MTPLRRQSTDTDEALPAYAKTEALVVPEEKSNPPEYTSKSATESSDQLEAGPSVKTPAGSSTSHSPVPKSGLYLDIEWTDTNSEPMDIGALLDLRINSTIATCLRRRAWAAGPEADPIYPCFKTYCIDHSHSLKWKMSVLIAGETSKFEAEIPITVFGPSEGL